MLYQGTNIVAGIFLYVNPVYWKAYPSAALNLAWICISIFTLGRKRVVQK